MPLANYTTTVSAARTVAEIQDILAKHGAREILSNYSEDGIIESLSFIVATPYGNMGIRLPVNPEAVLRVLERQNVPRHLKTREQAVKIAWRIVKDWVRAQMAILETEMVKLEQIFLPYAIVKDGKTLFESMVEQKFLLMRGESDVGSDSKD